jgi:hypothetical protein
MVYIINSPKNRNFQPVNCIQSPLKTQNLQIQLISMSAQYMVRVSLNWD